MACSPYASSYPILRSLRIYRGDTWRQIFRWGYRDTETGPTTYYDLTGYTARCMVRRRDNDSLLTSAATVTLNVSPTGAAENGWIIVTLDHSVTQTLPLLNAVADLELTSPSGQRTTLVRWVGQIEGDVSYV